MPRLAFLRRRSVRFLLVVSLGIALIGAGGAWYAAGRLLEPFPRAIGAPPQEFPAERVMFDSPSGARIVGWHQQGEPGRGVVVLAHGIRSDRRSLVDRAKLIAEAGFATLLIDLRGHGESTSGGNDFIGLGHLERLDVQAAVGFAKQRHAGEPIGVVGFSLGGAAIALAAPLAVDAVVLEAVYPTIEDAVHNRTARFGVLQPLASWTVLVQLQPRTGIRPLDLRPVDAAAQLGCPVLVVGGGRDKFTTPDDTRKLFAAAVEPKQLVWFDDLAHSNFARWQPERYRSEVVGFLNRYLVSAAADE